MKSILSTAFAVVALGAASLAPAFAQSISHDGTALPRYYDSSGEQRWGSWGPAVPPTTGQQTAQPPRRLYMYVKPSASHARVH
jgi:hypothetical protein